MDTADRTNGHRIPWNKGRLLGPKPPLKPKEIWAIRIRLQMETPSQGSCTIQSRHRQQAAGL